MMTELEALNLMLSAAEEAPVQTITQPGHLPLSVAKGILEETSRVVQSLGWSFNTEYEYPFGRTVDGRIPLAPNTLSIDIDDKWTAVSPVQRGLALYDRKAHSYQFPSDLTGTLLVMLPWVELPQPARYYIAVRAARVMQVRMQTSETSHQFTAENEQQALEAIQSYEADTSDANFLTDSHSVASVLLYRE
jgi:hypothetical protein